MNGCIERCVNGGTAHGDIEWRHTTIFPKITESIIRGVTVEIEFCFVDLGRMTTFTGRDAKQLARNKMRSQKLDFFRATIKPCRSCRAKSNIYVFNN